MQGKLVIGTEIDDSGFNKDLSKLERRQLTKEVEVKATMENLDREETTLKTMLEDVSQLEKKYYDVNEQIKEQQKIISSVSKATGDGKIMVTDYPSFEKATNEVMRLKDAQSQIVPELDKINNGIIKQEQKVNNINTKYQRQKMQLEEINAQISKSSLASMEKSIKGVGKGMTGVLKQVKRWALAIFGIRSAYMLLRRSMSTLTEHNAQLKADIEYIRNSIAFALEPVIIRIVDFVKRLLYYIAYIIKAWTGKNIFENANKSLKGSNKEAKKLQKTLASFDEMNILNDNSDSGGGAGGAMPSFDLSQLEGPEPKWLKWIADHKDEVLSFLAGVIAFFKVVNPLIKAFGLGLGMIKALGIGIAIAGIVYTILSLINYLKDPTWENFSKVIIGIGITLVGIGVAIGAWPVIIAGAIVTGLGLLMKYWEDIKAFLQNGIDWFTSKSDWVHEHLGGLLGTAYDNFVGIFQDILDWVDNVFTNIKKIFDGFIKFFKNVFKGEWSKAWEGLKEVAIGVWDVIITTIEKALSIIKRIVIVIATTVGQIISEAFKVVVNAVLGAIEGILNFPINAINALIGVINKVPGINLGTLPTFNLPRLAKGGIVNNPGPGVMMGSYIAGESGPEAVIPLNDETMDRLGSSIARHMTINANIVNTMNGRVISKELKRINNEADFAFNS